MASACAGKLVLNDVFKDFVQGNLTTHVLKGISAEFHEGKSYSIIGVSGSGKSTLLHIAGGLDNPSRGTVILNDRDIYGISVKNRDRLLNQEFGFMFQFHYLIKELTILENIVLIGLIKRESKKKCLIRAEKLLSILGLKDKKNSYPGQLSGGEQQRVAFARAIFNKPTFMFADEPTGNLDHENATLVIDLMLEAQKEWGMGIILCSHDPSVYRRMEFIYKLQDGLLTVN